MTHEPKSFDRNYTQESDLEAINGAVPESVSPESQSAPATLEEESRFTKTEKWFIVAFTAFVGLFRCV